jgi:hypothetical protein
MEKFLLIFPYFLIDICQQYTFARFPFHLSCPHLGYLFVNLPNRIILTTITLLYSFTDSRLKCIVRKNTIYSVLQRNVPLPVKLKLMKNEIFPKPQDWM